MRLFLTTVVAAAVLTTTSCKSLESLLAGPTGSTDASSALSSAPDTGAVAVRAVVTSGRVRTQASSKELWLQAIQAQLQYLVGALHEEGAIADMNALEIALRGTDSARAGERDVAYAATFNLSWPSSKPLPTASTWSALVPRSADSDARRDFFARYGAACGAARDEGASAATFWSSYRPGLAGCPLKNAEPDDATTGRLTLLLEPAHTSVADATAAKPAYAPAWSDGRLVAALVLPTDDAVQSMSSWLHTSVGAAKPQGAAAVYTIPGRGQLVVHLATPTSARRWPADVWSSAELVAFGSTDDTAHASTAAQALGGGPAAWTSTRLVLVTAGDRIAYADPALRTAAATGPDLVVTASPDDPAAASWRATAALVKALLEATASYDEIAASVQDAGGRSLRVQIYPAPSPSAQVAISLENR
jgi:hypothetical protein